MALLLGLDTSTPRGNLALGRFDASYTTLAGVYTRSYDGASDHAERLLGEIDALLAESGYALADVGALAVGVGPGSFTGVRVGVATAKALGVALRVPAVPVGSLEAMAHACEGFPDRARVAVLDARRGELFAAVLDAHGAELLAPCCLARSAFDAWLAALGPAVLLGALPDEPSLPPHVLRHRSPLTDLPGPAALLSLGLARLRSPARVDLASLEPAYVRPPDAALPT